MSKRTFCIFSAQYLPHIGGVEVFTKNLSEALAGYGCHVVIVTNNIDGLKAHEYVNEGIEIFRLPCWPLLKGRMPLPKKNGQYRHIMDALRSMSFDGIVINTRFYVHTIEALCLAKRKNCKAVIIDHGSDYLTFGNPFLDIFVKIYEHLITAITKSYHPEYYGISTASLKWLETFGIQGKGVIGNAIDSQEFLECGSSRDFRSEFSIQDDEMVITYTGRLIPEKGIARLLKCAEALENEHGYRFLLAGDGPMKTIVETSGLDNVSFLGRLESDDISSLMQQSDVFAFLSRSEGFGGSLLEAAIAGNALVTENVGIAENLVPSTEYGILLEAETSTSEIVDVFKRLHDDPKSRKLMGKACKERANSLFSWENSIRQVFDAFDMENEAVS